MKRLFTSSKWLAVLLAMLIAGVCAAFDVITPEQLIKALVVLVGMGVGGTALEDSAGKLRDIFHVEITEGESDEKDKTAG